MKNLSKCNKTIRGLCLGLGITSILSIAPAYASGTNSNSYADGEMTTQENSSNSQFDGSFVSEYVIPTDGDFNRLNVGWTSDGGIRYYCKDESRVKVTGWQNINNKWYYFDTSNYSMQTGWLKDGDSWYYLTESSGLGEGKANIKNGLGSMQTGWLKINGLWYYFNDNGAMKTGWLNDGGTWYYLYSNGSMAYNTTIDGYTVGSDGAWVK